jgi:hypothetical protein
MYSLNDEKCKRTAFVVLQRCPNILAQDIRERADYDCEDLRMEQMSKLHKQRAKGTIRYYQPDFPK